MTKLTERASDTANGLLSKVSGRTGIELACERATTDAALFQLTFDRTDAGSLDEGLHLAMDGRIAEAALLPGVTLSPGSLIEHAFAERAAFTFQFFDLWNQTDCPKHRSSPSRCMIASAGPKRRIELHTDCGPIGALPDRWSSTGARCRICTEPGSSCRSNFRQCARGCQARTACRIQGRGCA